MVTSMNICARRQRVARAPFAGRVVHTCAAPTPPPPPPSRRAALTALVAAPVAGTISAPDAALAAPFGTPGAALSPGLATYSDTQDTFSIDVPEGWTLAQPSASTDRFRAGVSSVRTLAWFPESGTTTNVSIVINTPGADYTRLSSFGSAADFGSNLVASMDRSFTAKTAKEPVQGTAQADPKPGSPPMQVARLVSTASADDSYFAEYTIQRGDEEQKHLWSRVAMGSNGRTRRFYTVTAQCPEGQRGEVGDALELAVASLKLGVV